MIFIYATFPNKKEALKIGEGLVQKKLAACVNAFPTDAIYAWQGKIVKPKEYAALIKTRKENFRKIERFILANHSYETPCVLEIPIGQVTQKYLRWLKKQTPGR